MANSTHRPEEAANTLLISESTEQWWDDQEFWETVRQLAVDRLEEIEAENR